MTRNDGYENGWNVNKKPQEAKKKGALEKHAKEILNQYPKITKMPASLSGRFHDGETVREHLVRVSSIMRHLCDACNIHDEARDVLISAAYLHDLGNYPITVKGRVKSKVYKYFPQTGWSRHMDCWRHHGHLSATVLKKYGYPRRIYEKIAKLVRSHMAHWFPHCEQPRTMGQYLVVIADYLSTRYGDEVFNYEGERRLND